MTKYNLEHKGVTCTAVDWESHPYKFVFLYNGKEFIFEQKRYISQSADTDHIRCVIEQFLEDYGDVIQVVRCIDCQYCEVIIDIIGNPQLFCTRSKNKPEVDFSDYCSYGKRKEQR